MTVNKRLRLKDALWAGLALTGALALSVALPPALAQQTGGGQQTGEPSTQDGQASGKPKGLFDFSSPPEPAAGGDAFGSDLDALLGADNPLETPGEDTFVPIPEAPGQTGSVVSVGDLEELAGGPVGLLTPVTGGFPEDMWAGSERETIERSIATLPVDTGSRTLTDLARRVLLSRAGPPTGEAKAAKTLLAYRLDRLYAAGWTPYVEQMLTRIPFADEDPGLVETRTRIALANHDLDRACSDAARLRSETSALFWTRLQSLCYGLVEDRNRANLTADLLRERGLQDKAFFALIADLVDGVDAKLTAIETPDAVHLALLRQTENVFPPSSLAEASPGMLAALAADAPSGTSPLLDLGDQIVAAERAVLAGAFDAGRLADVYRLVEIGEGGFDGLSAQAESAGGPLVRAQLYQAFEAETAGPAQLKWVQLAVADYEAAGLLDVAVELFEPRIRSLAASVETAWAAPTVLKLLAARENEGAL
ncbi:MAG: hypothetical protein AAGB03_07575, partial [Pseudomonadota bacterium]